MFPKNLAASLYCSVISLIANSFSWFGYTPIPSTISPPIIRYLTSSATLLCSSSPYSQFIQSINLWNASSKKVKLPMWTSDKNTIPKSISFSGTLTTPGFMICWPKAKLESSLLLAITPMTSSLTSFSASANNSSFLFENKTEIVPVSSSNSTILWPFLLDLISRTIKIIVRLSCESSISAIFVKFLSSGLLCRIFDSFSYLLLK